VAKGGSMKHFTYSHPKQREFFLSFVDTFDTASQTLKDELSKETPNMETLTEACGAIQHDLNALRHAYLSQFAAKPSESQESPDWSPRNFGFKP
jgi:hypothetical protein